MNVKCDVAGSTFFSKTTFSNKCGGIRFTDLWNNGLALQMTLWEKQANIRLAHLQWDKPTQYSFKYKFSVTCSYVLANCLWSVKVNGFQAITVLQILHYREMSHELVNGFHLWCFWTIPELHIVQWHRMASQAAVPTFRKQCRKYSQTCPCYWYEANFNTLLAATNSSYQQK